MADSDSLAALLPADPEQVPEDQLPDDAEDGEPPTEPEPIVNDPIPPEAL